MPGAVFLVRMQGILGVLKAVAVARRVLVAAQLAETRALAAICKVGGVEWINVLVLAAAGVDITVVGVVGGLVVAVARGFAVARV